MNDNVRDKEEDEKKIWILIKREGRIKGLEVDDYTPSGVILLQSNMVLSTSPFHAFMSAEILSPDACWFSFLSK